MLLHPKTLKNYFDPDYLMNPGGTIGLDLLPEEKRFLREHREYNVPGETEG